MTDRPTHWLRLNAAARIPRRVICLDSEALKERSGHVETQRFRLAAASFDRLDTDGHTSSPTERVDAASPAELWDWVAGRTAQSHKTVLFAHKLDYDLRLTEGLEQLPRLGFRCKGIGLNPHSTWARFNDGKRSLWLCDSLTFLPATLDRIAGLLRLAKQPMPADDAPDSVWLERCRGDVEVLRAAILHYIRLVRREDLGDFRLTGSAQASAAFRHRFLEPKTLLIHNEPEALAAERRAAFAGRCEVWRHGKIRGPIYEYDFTASYARIARDHSVPSRLWGEHTLLPPHRLAKVREYQAVLADVVVRTEVPCVPAALDGRILWPVGEFRTTLWDCELDLLESEGGSYAMERMWVYDRAPLLHNWATWVLDGLDGKPPGDDPIARLMLKHWSRALIGRFGLRYPVLEDFATDDRFDLSLMPVWDEADQQTRMQLQIGQDVKLQTGVVESGNSAPMIMSWVMAKARCDLWQLMRLAGLENVLYVDTDGLLVNSVRWQRDSKTPHLLAIEGVRLKGEYSSADLRSPRNLDVGDDRRIAGVPRNSHRSSPGRFQAEVWESLPSSLRRRRSSRVVLSERQFSVKDRDPRRKHLPGGVTAPLRLPAGSSPACADPAAQPSAAALSTA